MLTMTADELLAKLEKGDMVSPEIIATLRKQVTASKEPIAPTAITKLLVDKGHLTAGQAARLVDAPAAASPSQIAKKPAALPVAKAITPSAIQKTAAPASAKSAAKPAPASASHNSSVLDDLGLAPLEDLEDTGTLAAPSSPTLKTPIVKPAATPAPAAPAKAAPQVAPLAPLDDLGLADLDDLAPATPPASPTPTPQKSAIQKAPAKPAAAPAKPAPQVDPLPALDDLGLADLDDLSSAAAPPSSAPTPQKSVIQKAPAKPAAAPATAAKAAPAAKPAAQAGGADLPPLDDLGGDSLTVMDDLQSLDSLSDPLGGADPLSSDPLGGGATADLGALATQTSAPSRAQISSATMAAATAAAESRTTLYVGLGIGGAALLVLAVGLALFFWPRGSGMVEFQAAEQAYTEKQYSTAIEKYDELLRSHPRHEQASLIRVHRGLCEIYAANTSPGDWERLLPTMVATTETIAAEPSLSQAHAELAPLLIQMTEDLAEAATENKPDDKSAARLQHARTALALCNDSRLLPSAQRPWQKLAAIEDRLQLLSRELQRPAALEQAKSALTQALSSGLPAALAEREKLLASYPELSGDPLWTELAATFGKTAVQGVKTSAESKAAERDPAKPATVVALPWQVLNAPLLENPPAPGERVALVMAAGAVHAVDTTTGQPRWSRYVAATASDRPLQSTDGKLAWYVDRQRSELHSVNAATGNLLWRQALSAPAVGTPLLQSGKIVVALADGKVLSIDSGSGEQQTAAHLPQGLLTGPLVSDGQLLQLADEGLLYVLSASDLKCTAAHYLGHDRGAAIFPPILLQQQVVVPLVRGEQTELLLVTLDPTSPKIKRQRVDGMLAAPLVVAGKRLLASTSQGKVHVLELAGESSDPFKLVQTIPPVNTPVVRFLQSTPDGIVAADRGLSQLKFDAAGKLQPGWSAFSVDLFDAGSQLHDQSLICVRYVPDQDAMFAAAISTADGLSQWQTPLHAPVVLLPGSEEASRPFAVAPAAVAKLLTLDNAADLSGELKKLLAQPTNTNLKASPLSSVIKIGDEQLIVPPSGSRELVVLKPADFSVRKLKLAGSLAGTPAVCGPNLLVPLSDGSIQCISSATGEATAASYLLASGSGLKSPAVSVIALDEAGKEALVGDGVSSLVRISLVAEPKPHWVEQTAVRLPLPLAAPAVSLGELSLAVDGRGAVHIFSLPDLNSAQPVDLKGGRLTWGPHRAGDCVLLATDRDELWCFDAARQPRWQQQLVAGQLVGPPLVRDNKLIFTTQNGQVEVRAAGSGDLAASLPLAQPLAGSKLLSGNTLWLTTTFGQVLQAAIPTELAAP